MPENDDSLLELIAKTVAFDEEASADVIDEPELTFKRDEDGILWSYEVQTGKKVGRVFEHGDDDNAESEES